MRPISVPTGRAHGWLRPDNTGHSCGAGTVGAILRSLTDPARLYALTAGHVLGGAAGAAPGDTVSLHLAARDSLRLADGRAARWLPDLDCDAAFWILDAGLLEVDPRALEPVVGDLDWPVGWAAPAVGKPLQLLTRHHRLPAMTERPLPRVRLEVGPDARLYELRDCWVVRIDDASRGPGGHGSVAGDSGAALWDDQDRLVGINVGAVEFDEGERAVMVPIERVLDWCSCVPVLRGEALVDGGRDVVLRLPEATDAVDPSRVPPAAIDTLARTLWGEARGEVPPREAMAAVAHVVLNRRARPGWWGRSIEGVCRAPKQFSCWNADDPNLPKLQTVTLSNALFALALDVATELVTIDEADPAARCAADPTRGATHYHVARMRPPPGWARAAAAPQRIGNHLFYRDIG